MRSFLPVVAAITIAIGACADLATSPAAPNSAEPRAALIGTAPQRSDLQLLVCPNAQADTARATIGLMGGTISVGGSSIKIPLGAVLVPTAFEVIVPASGYMEVEIHAVGQDSYLFALPATVTIDYSRCAPDAVPPDAALQGVHINSLSKLVLELMGGAVDAERRTLRFLTGHLSGYAVAYKR